DALPIYQVNFAVPDLPPYRHPAAIDRDARALPFERLQLFLFKEAFEAALRVAAVLADHTQRATFGRFGNQPVKVRRIIGHEPDPGGIGRAVFRQAHDGLNEWHRLDGGPAGSTRHSARGAICANHAVRVQLFALAAGFHFQPQAAGIRTDIQETRIER